MAPNRPGTPLRFDHIGVVVTELARGREHLRDMLGVVQWTEEFTDPVNQVHVQFGRDFSGICYETIAPFGETSPVRQALRNGARILNHVAYLTPDLDAAGAHLAELGCLPTAAPKPALAYRGSRIQFFLSPLRFMVELIEAFEHQHAFRAWPGGDTA